MPEPKIYVPRSSAREHVYANGGKILKLSFKAADLREFLNQHVNDKGYVNLIVAERKEMGQYGDTHSVYLDTWKPKAKEPGQPAANPAPSDTSDIPF